MKFSRFRVIETKANAQFVCLIGSICLYHRHLFSWFAANLVFYLKIKQNYLLFCACSMQKSARRSEFSTSTAEFSERLANFCICRIHKKGDLRGGSPFLFQIVGSMFTELLCQSGEFHHLVDSFVQAVAVLTTGCGKVGSTTAAALDELGGFAHHVAGM